MQLFVNNLTVIDFSYLDAQRGLVGESLIVDINLKGELDDQSMVMDFSSVKKEIKRYLDVIIDHSLVIPTLSTQISFSSNNSSAAVTLYSHDGDVECYVSGPEESFCAIQERVINSTVLEQWLNEKVNDILPSNIESVSIKLREEFVAGYYYHYAHGLKKHAGNCQRIAHGHRSAIRIFVEGERNSSWEMYWAERWRDCYLMSSDDIIDFYRLSSEAKNIFNDSLIASRYTSSQGKFEILIKHWKVEILPHDTTVERIAHYILQEIKSLQPDLKDITVHAYEGIEKGAII